MDRFSDRSIPDPQAAPIVGECDECGGEIYLGQNVWRHGHDRFCSMVCFKQYVGVAELTIDD